jgi:hypothetical protein
MLGQAEEKLKEFCRKREWGYCGKIPSSVLLPDWEEVIRNIEEVRHHPPEKRYWERNQNLNFQMMHCRKMFSVEIIRTHLQKIFYKNDVSAHCYFTLSNERGRLGHHCDSMDVIYIQGINNIDAIIWDRHKDKSGKKMLFNKIMEPGEMIYIPAGTYHQFKVFEPRAALSIGIEDAKEILPTYV